MTAITVEHLLWVRRVNPEMFDDILLGDTPVGALSTLIVLDARMNLLMFVDTA